MNDEEFIAALQALFDANDPGDGIDRHDGFGSDLRVTGLRAVADGDFPELEVRFALDLPLRLRIRRVPRTGTTRVLFDRDWMALSGFVTPAEYAREIARQVSRSAYGFGDSLLDGWRRRRLDTEAVARSVAPVDVLWANLLTALGKDGESATVLSEGVIEAVDDEGTFWIHVTPDEWRSNVIANEIGARLDRGVDASRAGDGPEMAYFYLDEMVASRWDGEHHIVYFRGRFERSIRAELPPVRDADLRKPVEPISGGAWYAFGPDGEKQYFDDEDD